jgi:leucyl-tRNA synthetase
MTKDDEIDMVVQVNGKVRETIKTARGTSVEKMKEMALESPKIKTWVEGREIIKVITVPDKLVNIVIKG